MLRRNYTGAKEGVDLTLLEEAPWAGLHGLQVARCHELRQRTHRNLEEVGELLCCPQAVVGEKGVALQGLLHLLIDGPDEMPLWNFLRGC